MSSAATLDDIPLSAATLDDIPLDVFRGIVAFATGRFTVGRLDGGVKVCGPEHKAWSAHVERPMYTYNALPERIGTYLCDVLLVLQFYWFSLLVKAAVKKMRTGTLDDVRSDDEDDEAEPEPKKTK